jgi:hypothetical protein
VGAATVFLAFLLEGTSLKSKAKNSLSNFAYSLSCLATSASSVL